MTQEIAPPVERLIHMSIPVSLIERSAQFYTDIVGLRMLTSFPRLGMCFLDAGGICVILVKQKGPINPVLQNHEGVHHAFVVDASELEERKQFLQRHGVEIFFEEDRQGGVVNGPRLYFRDPDGTVLEFVALTLYSGSELQ